MCRSPLRRTRPEFVSRALLKWIVDQGIETALIDPGKPWQNGALESLNGKFRDECLGMEWSRSRGEAIRCNEAISPTFLSYSRLPRGSASVRQAFHNHSTRLSK